jgi:hypothetical protein
MPNFYKRPALKNTSRFILRVLFLAHSGPQLLGVKTGINSPAFLEILFYSSAVPAIRRWNRPLVVRRIDSALSLVFAQVAVLRSDVYRVGLSREFDLDRF